MFTPVYVFSKKDNLFANFNFRAIKYDIDMIIPYQCNEKHASDTTRKKS